MTEIFSSNKVVTEFYDNGQIKSVRDEKNNIFVCYYENGNLETREEEGYVIHKDIDGTVNYELKDGKLVINPEWFSYYRLGIKSKDNETHWQEKGNLDPKKKTLVSLGGKSTRDARAANGNNNLFANILGLSEDQKDNMQFVACYRPQNFELRYLFKGKTAIKEQIRQDYKREILQKFMCFMASVNNEKLEKLSDQELVENFGNIMIMTHCAGDSDLLHFNQVFKETMNTLGYNETLQKEALKQIVCITSNSQREMTDNFDFTCIHRYSVKDGQPVARYNTEESAEYPVFVQDYEIFAEQKGNKAAFIEIKPNEVIMIFDKILENKSAFHEHNGAFFSTDEESLSRVGKYHRVLMSQIGQYWYNNRSPIGNVMELIEKVIEKSTLHAFVKKAISLGKKVKEDKKNMLVNHHILKSIWNKYNNPNNEVQKFGVFKFLSDNYEK